MTNPLTLLLDRFVSPIGTILLVCDHEERLCALDFEDCEARMYHLLRRHYRDVRCRLADGRAPRRTTEALGAFFAGDIPRIDAVPVETGGTDFQRRIWGELRRIPAGTTTTYGALARRIGRPSASRAVGAANGANPVSIVVPCHRLIGVDAALTGYSGGLDRKRWLLDHERKWNPQIESEAPFG